MMKMARFRKGAQIDLFEHFAHIGEHNIEAARRFKRSVNSDVRELADMPGIGARRETRHERLQGLRSWPVGDFRNYLILYLEAPDGIEIIAVTHGARDIEAMLERRA